ncbi:hypothetical protein CN577_11590 [Bacillus toyonensis]|uniref:hypothetical protein n=1 Tax=Bacillus toyonensis TaxID=155322 RepID=UPI000BF000AB|nr:hypothetical protein [Bacillus toyonensis]PEP08173.1 hypothetical protein CN577_11590 [Bacillus toyonensis]
MNESVNSLVVKFSKDIKNEEPLYVFLKTHLYVESIMIQILEKNVPNPKAIKFNTFNFAQKVQLVHALNIMEDDMRGAYNKFNRVRNDLAHYHNKEIDEETIKELYDTLPKDKKWITQEFCPGDPSIIATLRGFCMLLVTYLISKGDYIVYKDSE